MSNPDPGAATNGIPLDAAWFNTVRTGVVNALDVAGGTRTLTSKLTLNGTDKVELGDKLLYTSASLTLVRPVLLGYHDSSRWSMGVSSTAGPGLVTTSTTAGLVALPLDVPHDNVMTSVGVWYKATAGHGGAPANMPTLIVYKRAQSTGTRTQIGSTTTDTYGSAGAYETRRVISVSGLSETIDNTANVYYIEFTSEGGANAIVGAVIDSITITCTLTKQPKWR